jgi:hypothetical protein
MLNLYFSGRAWPSVSEDVQKVVDFFRQHETIRTKDGRTFFGRIQADANFAPAYVLARKGATYIAKPVKPADTENTFFSGDRSRQLTHIPFLSLLLSKEDLLWVATSAVKTPKGTVTRSKAQLLLERMWGLHVSGLHGRKFDDNIADEIVRSVCYTSGDKIPQAALWISGAVVEVVVPSWQSEPLQKLCAELEQEMAKTAVLTAVSTNTTYAGTWTTPAADFLATTEFVPDSDGNLVARTLGKPLRIVATAQMRTSGPFSRGLCINTTQAAILTALAPGQLLESVDHLLAVCSDELAKAADVFPNTSVVSAGSASTTAVSHLLPAFKKSGSGSGSGSGSVTAIVPDARLFRHVAYDISELAWLLSARRTGKSALAADEEVGASSLISVMMT